jgi:phage tail sheath protein FI
MPDYLSPGVYIEELPPALRAIEGVSTSIAGFVGVAERGPVAGFAPPPAVPGSPQAPSSSLVTSFADFTRQFGAPLPLPDPNNNAYLAYAVKGFFDNGGSACYVSRVVSSGAVEGAALATYSSVKVNNGTVLRLARATNTADTTLYLNSLRQITADPTGATQNLTLIHRADGSSRQLNVTSYDARAKTVTLSAAINEKLSVTDIYLVPVTVPPSPLGSNGPTFLARNPGSWGDDISILITPSDRPAVGVSTAGTAAAQQITVQNTASFYIGAIIEIDRVDGAGHPTAPNSRSYHEVTALLPGGVVQLGAQVGADYAATSLVRVVEIDVSISDPTAIVATSETYAGLSWNSNAGSRYYAAVINANSNLAFVQPDANESAAIASQPTTVDGFATSPAAAWQATRSLRAIVNRAATAATGVVNAINALTGQAFPLVAPNALLTALTAAEQEATNAAAAVTAATTSAGARAVAAQATAAAVAAQNAAAAAGAGGGGAPAVAAALIAAEAAQTAANAANAAFVGVPSAGTPGNDGATPVADDYVGLDNGPGARTGIAALTEVENISIIAAPGQTSVEVQAALIDQCELLHYRFAVLDGKQYLNGLQVNDVLAQRDNYDSSYAALYVPWLQITLNGQNVFIPPSGHVVGIYAGTDNARGVWKAPANVVVQNITGLQSYIVTGEQDILNPAGVNCIRRFDTLGTRVWGARTISSDDSLMYVNVRRTLIFLEASIDYGTQWVVFEPNNPDTWGRVTDSVTAFLMTQWTNGALFGVKPTDSFFVRCDLTTMTADDIQNGRLICLIGVAIVRPAEFVIFRIEQITGLPTQ